MKSLNIAYFGSSYFSANLLEQIITNKELPVKLKSVVTQPDSPVGRKQILTPTPVKVTSQKFRIPVYINLESRIQNSESKKEKIINSKFNSEFITLNSKLVNIDLALVYAFGELIPKEILNLPKYGFWNIHPSLLPKYRGPSPIASPLIKGETTTGVTIIKMDAEIDHGPIVAQQSLTIGEDDKRPDLEKKLTDLGFEMFKKILSDEDAGARIESRLIKQNDKLATYTKKLTKKDGFIPFENLIPPLAGKNSSEDLYNLFRGLYPWPGIWTMIKPIQLRQLDEAKRLKITDMELVNGKLIIKKVQLEGKKEVDFETFKKAYKFFEL